MGPRQFTRRELEGRNQRHDALFVIDNVVYDVTQFLDDHPGGVEILLDNAGKDASKCFHDVGHSEDAREWMRRYVVGEVVAEDRREVVRREGTRATNVKPVTMSTLVWVWTPPMVLAAIAFCSYNYLFP